VKKNDNLLILPPPSISLLTVAQRQLNHEASKKINVLATFGMNVNMTVILWFAEALFFFPIS